MIVRIQALKTELTQDDLKKNIPEEILSKLEGKTITPYIIGEPGISKPRVIGEGAKPLTWGRSVIRKMAESVKAGTKFFKGHNSDNSTKDRVNLGEVVYTFTQNVGDSIRAIALGVLNGNNTSDLDVCSVEADIITDGNEVSDIKDVTAIALGSSRVDTPAFMGARRLQAIQCFNNPDRESGKTGEEKKMTFKELQDAIKEMNVYPHQIFTREQIRDDKIFGKDLTDLETKVSEKETELTTLKSSTERKSKEQDIVSNLEKMFPEGLTDKQKTFIKKNFSPSSIEELTDENVKKNIEELQTKYADYAKMFGVDENENPNEPPKGKEPNVSEEEEIFKELTK